VRLAVLVSGSGTLLETILAENAPVALVLADRKCRGLEVAAQVGVPTELLERTDFSLSFDREGYTERIEAALAAHAVDLVAMAGFMTVLAPSVFDAFPGRILNTHPALLPSFRGAHAVRDALAAGVKVTGCTVHVATAEVDAGPILAQEAVPVLPGDDEATLHERIKAVERRLYPVTIKEILGS